MQSLEAKEFTLDIIRDMKRRVEEWSDQYDYHFYLLKHQLKTTDRSPDQIWEIYLSLILQIRNITPILSTTMFVKLNQFEKLILKKFIQKQVRQVVSSIVRIRSFNKTWRPSEVWDYAHDRCWLSRNQYLIDRCYKCDLKGIFEPTERGFACPNWATATPKADVKRTCGYLGNSSASMANGRHSEIAARVKHMNGSTIKTAGHEVTNCEGNAMGKYQLDDKDAHGDPLIRGNTERWMKERLLNLREQFLNKNKKNKVRVRSLSLNWGKMILRRPTLADKETVLEMAEFGTDSISPRWRILGCWEFCYEEG